MGVTTMGKGAAFCDGSCCSHGGCIRWTSLVLCSFFMIAAAVSVGMPGWYKVEVNLNNLKDVSVPSGKEKLKSLSNLIVAYGVADYCQNYAKEHNGNCEVAPLYKLGTSENDKALTLSSGETVTADDTCCDTYEDGTINFVVSRNFTAQQKFENVKNSIMNLDVTKDVPTTTMAISITALVFQFFAFISLVITVICCHGKCAHTMPIVFTALAAFFYMVVGAYWQVQVVQGSAHDNAYVGHCTAEKALFTSLWKSASDKGADLGSLNTFVDCRSFVCYYGMWVNMAMMILAAVCQGWAQSRALDGSEAEQVPLTNAEGMYSRGP